MACIASIGGNDQCKPEPGRGLLNERFHLLNVNKCKCRSLLHSLKLAHRKDAKSLSRYVKKRNSAKVSAVGDMIKTVRSR